jgi:hypothetical protein
LFELASIHPSTAPGARDNTVSQIRANNAEVISVPTPGLLSSQWLQTYWVSLHETVLEVGQGDRIGMRQVMAARVPSIKGDPRELFVGFAAWNSTANFVYGMKEADAAELVLPAPSALPTAAPTATPAPTEEVEAAPSTSPTATAAPSPSSTPSSSTAAPRATTASPRAASPAVVPHVPFMAPGNGGLYQRFAAAQVSAAGFAVVIVVLVRRIDVAAAAANAAAASATV